MKQKHLPEALRDAARVRRSNFLLAVVCIPIGFLLGRLNLHSTSKTALSDVLGVTPSIASEASSGLSVVHAASVPTTMVEAQKNLAKALTQAWDLGQDIDIFRSAGGTGVGGPVGGMTPGRYLLDKFIGDARRQLGPHLGPNCLDWSDIYMKRFSKCARKFDFQYSSSDKKYVEPAPGRMGLIKADLGGVTYLLA